MSDIIYKKRSLLFETSHIERCVGSMPTFSWTGDGNW